MTNRPAVAVVVSENTQARLIDNRGHTVRELYGTRDFDILIHRAGYVRTAEWAPNRLGGRAAAVAPIPR